MRQVHRTDPLRAVALERGAPVLQVAFERHHELVRKRHDANLAALSISYENSSVVEVEIFNPYTHAFKEPQSRAVLQAGDQPVSALELSQNDGDFGRREYHGYALQALGPHDAGTFAKGAFKNVAIQEDQCIERLILRGRGDLPCHCQMRKKSAHLVFTHFAGGRLALKRMKRLIQCT